MFPGVLALVLIIVLVAVLSRYSGGKLRGKSASLKHRKKREMLEHADQPLEREASRGRLVRYD